MADPYADLFDDLANTADDTPESDRTAAQAAAWELGNLDAEVLNGGFQQYLDNWCPEGSRLGPIIGLVWLTSASVKTLHDILCDLRDIAEGGANDRHFEGWHEYEIKLNLLDDRYYTWRQGGGLGELCRFLGVDPTAYVIALNEQAARLEQSLEVPF